jgi:hypothetical protein
MAGYGCARTYARHLDDDEAAELLQQTLDEEGAADKELTRIAQSGINQAARDRTSRADRSAAPRRLRYVDTDDLPSAADYREWKVRNATGDDLGRVDGFLVDSTGRPYYLVVDSGGLFVGRRYVVPVGKAELQQRDHIFAVDLDKDTLKRYPEFRRDAFLSMTDEEARRYEWRVIEAIDPTAARGSIDEWDYERFPYYREPQWFDTGVSGIGAPERSASRSGRSSTPRREVPITSDRENRERVTARERDGGSEGPARGRTSGKGDDEFH